MDVKITKEQLRLVKAFADGKSQKEVAEELGMNYMTFAFQLKTLRDRLGYKNTTHLVASFLRLGYIK